MHLSSLRESNSNVSVEVNSLTGLRQEAENMSKKDKREIMKSLIELRDLKHNLTTIEATKTEIITEVNKLKSNI
jgi:hypothetical protein